MYSGGHCITHYFWCFDNDLRILKRIDLSKNIIYFEKRIVECGIVRNVFVEESDVYLVSFNEIKITKYNIDEKKYVVYEFENNDKKDGKLYAYSFLRDRKIYVFSYLQNDIDYYFDLEKNTFFDISVMNKTENGKIITGNQLSAKATIHDNRIDFIFNDDKRVELNPKIHISGLAEDQDLLWITSKADSHLYCYSNGNLEPLDSIESQVFKSQFVDICNLRNYLVISSNEELTICVIDKVNKQLYQFEIIENWYIENRKKWRKIITCVEDEEKIIMVPYGLNRFLQFNKKNKCLHKMEIRSEISQEVFSDNLLWVEDNEVRLKDYIASLE